MCNYKLLKSQRYVITGSWSLLKLKNSDIPAKLKAHFLGNKFDFCLQQMSSSHFHYAVHP